MSGERESRTTDPDLPFAVASAYLPDGSRELVVIHYRSERDAEADSRRVAAMRRGEWVEVRV